MRRRRRCRGDPERTRPLPARRRDRLVETQKGHVATDGVDFRGLAGARLAEDGGDEFGALLWADVAAARLLPQHFGLLDEPEVLVAPRLANLVQLLTFLAVGEGTANEEAWCREQAHSCAPECLPPRMRWLTGSAEPLAWWVHVCSHSDSMLSAAWLAGSRLERQLQAASCHLFPSLQAASWRQPL